MIELVGSKTRVVCATPAYADACAAYVSRNRAFHEPWSPLREDVFFLPETCHSRLRDNERAFQSGTGYAFLVLPTDDDVVIGDINFTNVVRGVAQACALGYALDERYVGRGFMFDALQVALIWIFKELKMHRVAAAYIPTNERSGALLRRLGFTVEGYARDYLFINGRWRDHILTSFIMNDVAGLSSERAATRRRTWEGRVARSAAEFAAMKRRDQESE